MFGTSLAQPVYLSDTNGGMGLTPGTILARVGRSLTDNSMMVMVPYYENKAAGTATLSCGNNWTTIATGFTPTRVVLYCRGIGAPSQGIWMRSNSGANQQASTGWNAATSKPVSSPTSTCLFSVDATSSYAVTVATSTGNGGFTAYCTSASGDRIPISYFAERNDDFDSH
jgi:hypothetical protein